ncbi:MAG: hypothetical protein ACKOXV_06935 [Bacteroidota bacterium]
MITATATRTVSTLGNAVEASYTIQDSAKIFSILRSNIYSNKMLAVIREYSTNGWDGHILAGTPNRSLRITLPTSLAPEFRVRDFGVGLSEDSVMNIYTSYGTSTKDTSNDFNGTFGLGSKSAFAYGNAFDIISYFGGMRTMYTAYLDESNIGKIRKIYSEPTTEENGVEIVVAVKHNDIRSFNDTALEFYKNFQPCPEIINNTLVADSITQHHNRVATFSGSDWAIYNSNNRTESNVIIMGNVSYPIDLNSIPNKDNSFEIYGTTYYRSHNVVIEAPIGSLSITASRESLEYDKRTINWIIDKTKEIAEALVKDAQTKIDNAPTLWEALKVANNLTGLASKLGSVNLNKFQKDLTFSKTYGTWAYYDFDKISAKYGCTFKTYNWFNSSRVTGYKLTSLVPSDDVLFVLLAPKKVASADVNQKLRGVNAKHPNKKIQLVTFNDQALADEFVKSSPFVGAEMVKLEDYANLKWSSGKVAPVTVRNNDKAKCKIFSLTTGVIENTKSDNWTICDNNEIKNGSGVYVQINAFESVDSTLKMDYIVEIRRMCAEIGITMPTVYGIRDSVTEIGAGWTPLKKWIETQINNHISSNNLQQQLNDYSGVCPISVREPLASYSRFSMGQTKTGGAFDWMMSDNAPDGIVKDFVLKAKSRHRNVTANAVRTAYTLYSRGFNITLEETDWKTDFEKILAKYPLLEILKDNDITETQAASLYDYVRLIDNRTH